MLAYPKKANYWAWERLSLFLFIFALPLSARNVLFTYGDGEAFNEYLDISVYVSDIALLILAVISILKYKRIEKSIAGEMFHVEHILTAFFLTWIAATTFWSIYLPLAAYSALKLMEGILLFFVLRRILAGENTNMFHVEQIMGVPRGTDVTRDRLRFHVEHFFQQFYEKLRSVCAAWNITAYIWLVWVLSATFYGCIGILQFFRQQSLGLFWAGESVLSTDMAGVAEIIIGGDPIMRSYGLFPHPNVFGGYLLISLLITCLIPYFYSQILFHVERSGLKKFVTVSIILQLMALLSTFSRSALAGGVLVLLFFIFFRKKLFHVEQRRHITSNVPRGTFKNYQGALRQLFHVERILALLSTILFISAIFWWIKVAYTWQSLYERLFYLKLLKSIPLESWLFGLGAGQFVAALTYYYHEALLSWQLQPVHSVIPLMFSEIGVIGGALFFGMLFWFLIPMFHVEQKHENVPRGTKYLPVLFLLGATPIILMDHYLWTIQQGMLIFWFVLAYLSGLTNNSQRAKL